MNTNHSTIASLAADEIERRWLNRTTPDTTPFVADPVHGAICQKALHAELVALAGPELCAALEAQGVKVERTKRTPVRKARKTTSKARKATKPVAKSVPAEKAPSPLKGVSRYGLTPEQQAERDALFAKYGGGDKYHAECKKAGIPTKKNGLLVVA